MKVIPKPGCVLIERFKEEEKKGNIIIPDSYRKLTNRGRIVRLGRATEDKPQLYKEGDIVYFAANINMLPIIEGEKAYGLVNQMDIMASEVK